MPPVIPILFATVFGFGLGYKFKDCLCTKEKCSTRPNINTPKRPDASPNASTIQHNNSRFSLNGIEHLFSQFNVPLTSDYSFSRLLDAIEKDSYVSLLKHIDKKITSANELFHFLEDEKLNITDFEITDSEGEPYITQDVIDAILENKNVDYSHLTTIGEKVKFLLILAQGTGTKRFQESFGTDLTTFLNKYKSGQKADVVFEGIKTTVHNRLEFMS